MMLGDKAWKEESNVKGILSTTFHFLPEKRIVQTVFLDLVEGMCFSQYRALPISVAVTEFPFCCGC